MTILVVCPNWVGDAVMATPTLRALRHYYHSARIIGVMRPVIADVFQGSDYFDGWFRWNPKGARPVERTWPVIRSLRREAIDVAVLLPNSFQSAAIAWLAGAKRRVGYRRDARGLLLTDRLTPLRSGRRFVPSPIIDYYLKLAEHLGCPRDSYRMELKTTPSDELATDSVWRAFGLHQAKRVVVLNPGAAFGASKCWPTAHFSDLARRLVAIEGTRVLVLCGPAEVKTAREIVARSGEATVCSLGDSPVSIGLSKACVRRADLLITTDSGPRHFAAAFDVPVITLFGPTHIAWTETYFPKAIHMQKSVPCGPCQLRECPLDHRCMTELTPSEVFQQAQAILHRFPARRNVA
jgi:heptosyltransferase-2